ncbi:MAG TPA: hypothetical protein IGS52_07380 [Oscillatoriaceae cyanobacterium M33_DOE_052]|uniref:Uncharacterized protein n=1 Tax=Planktothricoides sp. SpSt-374 TaxID=2282167 RepID=A0A7C3ZMG8_9CYAN|nr:hypothetical protein [Oscillatoriaceae cyanobacterium M33_DOE_052]
MNPPVLFNIHSLERELHEHWAAQLPPEASVLVRCALKDSHLMVLAEHPISLKPDLAETFQALKEITLALAPKSIAELRIYLRFIGQKQPYAHHTFRNPQPLGVGALPPELAWLSLPQEEHVEEADNWSSAPAESIPVLPGAGNTSNSKWGWHWPVGGDGGSSLLANHWHSLTADWAQKKPKFSWNPRLAVYILPAFVMAALVMWVLKSPCTIGKCDPIASATRLNASATRTIGSAQYPQQLLSAKQELDTAVKELKTVPFWSKYASDASSMRRSYEKEAEYVSLVLQAMDLGWQAAANGKNPPLAIAGWEEIQSTWTKATTILRTIPAEATIYPFAQQKLQQYRGNLMGINRRLDMEAAATKHMEEAKSLARVAAARAGATGSISGWEEVQLQWQQALNLLALVPSQSIAAREALQLRQDYRTQLTAATERKIQEELAADHFQEAVSWAQEAEAAAMQNQWKKAQDAWREAINYAKKVPASTFYYPKAQSDIKTYTKSLTQAQAELKIALKLQAAGNSLKKVCSGSPKVCAYTLSKDAISVWLTPEYVRKVRSTAIVASTNGNYKALVGVESHVQILRQALETISNNAGIPLVLYDHYGAPIGRHSPS